ncbi:MAG: hypothetical protein OEW99_13160 [Gammaproteobacteria bacterium]|nr:hypothetical protein [Gammaproteobacteria bacterium]
MVSISGITFFIIIQTLIVFVILSAFLFFLLRSKNKKIKALANTVSEFNDVSPLASVEYYLTAEIKLIEGRFALLYSEEDLLKEYFGEADWLSLRRGFLEIEKALLKNDNLDNFWIAIGDNFKNILKINHLVKRIKVKEVNEDDEDDVKEMKILLKSQYDDFDNLYAEMEGAKSEAEVKQLKEKLSSIIRSHTELTHCVYILEDENLFLRNQINELL